MTQRMVIIGMAMAALLACAGCATSPGHPGANSETIPPNQVMEFNALYSRNCAGCHGAGGGGGAALALANPVFLAIADDSAIRSVTASGVRGTPMPAFAQNAGGMLMDKQIEVLVGGIRSWAKPDALRGATPPPFTSQISGNPQHGADAYRIYCASCHGADGRGIGNKAGSIVDPAYLALVSDQQLRTTVIAGRPDLGSPDWRGDVAGRPMSAEEVSDVVAWLSARRTQFPGQPYPAAAPDRTKGGQP